MKRTIIIGDVHGMAVELQSLLDKLGQNWTGKLTRVKMVLAWSC